MEKMPDQKEILNFVNENKTLVSTFLYLCVILLIHYVWSEALFPLMALFSISLNFLFPEEQPALLNTVIILNFTLSACIMIWREPFLILFFIQCYLILSWKGQSGKV